MDAIDYDFVVIGGGSAGYAAARTARESWDRIAIVDGSTDLGGLCILRGCMPSKTLLYAAEIRQHMLEAERLGLPALNPPPPDMRTLRDRKRRLVSEFADYRATQLQSEQFDLIRAFGRFSDPDTLELSDGRCLRARAFLIATGSESHIPAIPGLSDCGFVTSDAILDLDYLPDSVITLGGGIIACELSQFLSRMGSRVTMIQRSPQILRDTRETSAHILESAFRQEGIEVYTDTSIDCIERKDGIARVSFKHSGEPRVAEGSVLFNALGRRPATSRLNLQAAGIETLASGHIRTDMFQRSTNPKVYAAGDCAGPHEIVHVAIMQGETAARHATGRPTEPVHYDWMTRVVFTDPQVAFVGLDEDTMREQGMEWKSAEYAFSDHGKAIVMDALAGHVKVWAEAETGRILAAECVGKDAGELIHAIATTLPLGATVFDLTKVHWYHPTLAEIWSYPLEDLAEACTR